MHTSMAPVLVTALGLCVGGCQKSNNRNLAASSTMNSTNSSCAVDAVAALHAAYFVAQSLSDPYSEARISLKDLAVSAYDAQMARHER